MSLASSNTYIEPVAGSALNIARIDVNRSLRAVLTNFKSTSRPVSVNLVAGGGNIGEQDGMLFRSETTNALYISDANQVKSSPVGGNFTRVGIGNRVENGIVALAANATSYEIGELVATVSQDGGLAANARLYLCVSNTLTTGSASGFLDVGSPLGYSIGTNDNVTFTGQSVSALRFLATSNVGINTTSPATRLDVNGDVTITDRLIHSGDTNTQIRFPSNDTVTVETNGSERFRITSTGNVGINTTSPATSLHVNGDVTITDRLIHSGDTNTQIRFPAADTVTIETNGSERFRITSAGNVGINTTSPATSLDVNGDVTIIDRIIHSGDTNTQIRFPAADTVTIETNGSERFRVTSAGNVGIGTSTPATSLDVVGTVRATDFNSVSDIALKQDIQLITNALDKVHNINGYTFAYKDSQKSAAGVIAQEVEKILPQAVQGEEGNKSVAYGNLIALLIEAVKDLSSKIDALEKTKYTKS
jgi:hypothetical protein